VALAAVLCSALWCTLDGFCLLFVRMNLLSCSGDLIKDLCQTAINEDHVPNPDEG